MATFLIVLIAASVVIFSSATDDNRPSINPNHRDRCIILMGGLTLNKSSQRARASYEHYHPDPDVVCDVKRLPRWWRDNITPEIGLTCSLSATDQVVTIDSGNIHSVMTPAAVYSLEDRTVRYLPETDKEYENATRSIEFITSAGVSQCIACSQWLFDDHRYERTPLQCWKYDARKTQPNWQPIPPGPPPSMIRGVGVWLTDNDLYVIYQADTMPVATATATEMDDKPGELNWLFRYDISTGRLQQKQTAPGLRYGGCAATALLSTELLLCGGNGMGEVLRDCEIYDTTKGRWHATGRMNVARSKHSLITFNGEVYAIGGTSHGMMLSSVERYNRTSGTWMLVKPLKEPKEKFLPFVV